MRDLIHTGSVKDIYRLEDGVLEFEFSDRISVFDCPISSLVPGKGEALCDMACHWFALLDRMGIYHHMLERTGPKSIKVLEVKIIHDRDKIVDKKTNHLIPLENILRHYVAGSLFQRIKKGEFDPASLGLTGEVKIGTKLPKPMFELSTKLEDYDRLLNEQEALEVSKLTPQGLAQIRDTCLKIDAEMEREMQNTNLIHVDGKKEFGYDREGRMMVVDVFGTADEDRWWDREAYEKRGECIDLSKEEVRHHYRRIGFVDAVYAARAEGKEEPKIPPMPEDLIAQTSEIYKNIARQITGK